MIVTPCLLLALPAAPLQDTPPAEPLVAETSEFGVDLPQDGLQDGSGSVHSKPWYERVSIGGYAAVDFFDSGDAGGKPEAGFEVKQAQLFIQAEAWEDMRVFFEWRPIQFGMDDAVENDVGEAYLRFGNLFPAWMGEDAGLKVGRFDIPFGEEYLWQDAPDNPLFSQSAAFPWGFDEGLLVHGNAGHTYWIAAVTDGNEEYSVDDDDSKAFHLKVYGHLFPRLYASASALTSLDSSEHAIRLGGSNLQPVGSGFASSAGASPSETVDAHLWQVDMIWRPVRDLRFSGSYGAGRINDDVQAFDRDLIWFHFEPRLQLTQTVFAVARYSEIGTFDDDEGYLFDGTHVASSSTSLGYDVKRFRRVSAGLGYQPNPNSLFKLEVGRDHFNLIDGSSIDPDNDDRLFVAVEAALSF